LKNAVSACKIEGWLLPALFVWAGFEGFLIFEIMTPVLKHRRVSREAFLDYLASIEGKAEWLDGEIFDMAGGTYVHSLISTNACGEIRAALKGRDCRTFSSDLLLEIASDQSLVFPDGMVICGPPEFVLNRNDIVKNPTLILEVLSKDRADYDRGGKFTKYRSIPTLTEYVLVDQYAPKVDVFFRTGSGLWDIRSYEDISEQVQFQSISIQVPMTEIYRDVVFE
jgi:Uma2 family endonuclease